MANQRRLRLQRFGITEARYDEMKAFCRQYDDWGRNIRKIEALQSPSEMQLQLLKNYKAKKNAFDEAMKMTVEDEHGLQRALIENITRNKRFETLTVPMNKRTFNEFRTAFFVNLDRLI